MQRLDRNRRVNRRLTGSTLISPSSADLGGARSTIAAPLSTRGAGDADVAVDVGQGHAYSPCIFPGAGRGGKVSRALARLRAIPLPA